MYDEIDTTFFHTMGMTGFDGATNGGRLSPFGMAPVPAPTDAPTPATAAVPATFKKAFANFRMPELAPALAFA